MIEVPVDVERIGHGEGRHARDGPDRQLEGDDEPVVPVDQAELGEQEVGQIRRFGRERPEPDAETVSVTRRDSRRASQTVTVAGASSLGGSTRRRTGPAMIRGNEPTVTDILIQSSHSIKP